MGMYEIIGILLVGASVAAIGFLLLKKDKAQHEKPAEHAPQDHGKH